MHFILHTPTQTTYGLQRKIDDTNTMYKHKHTLVAFRREDDAKCVANSLSIYFRRYGHFPNSDTVFVAKPKNKKTTDNFHDIHDDLLIYTNNIHMNYIQNIGSRNLDLICVDEIRWNVNDYTIHYKTVVLDVPIPEFQKTIENDNTFFLE